MGFCKFSAFIVATLVALSATGPGSTLLLGGLRRLVDVHVAVTGNHRAVGLNPAFLSPVEHEFASFNSKQMLASLDGKLCLVTGANIGLGLETSRWLYQRGCTVVAAGRRPAAIEGACKSILGSSQKKESSRCVPMVMDLASFASVKSFADDFLKKFAGRQLDVLVANAGITFWKTMGLSEDDIEKMFHTNHLGHFLLIRLLDSVIAPQGGSASRVVVVSSAAHYGPFPTPRGIFTNIDELNDPRNWDGVKYYALSKLCNVLFTRELSKRLNAENRIAFVNAASPGMTKTNVTEEFRIKARAFAGDSLVLQPLVNMVINIFNAVENLVTWETADGARTQIYLAVAPEVEVKKITGRYFHPQAIEVPPSELALEQSGDNLAKDLWLMSESILKEKKYL